MVSLPFLTVNVVIHQFATSSSLEIMSFFIIKIEILAVFFRKTLHNRLFVVKNNFKIHKYQKNIFYLQNFAKKQSFYTKNPI